MPSRHIICRRIPRCHSLSPSQPPLPPNHNDDDNNNNKEVVPIHGQQAKLVDQWWQCIDNYRHRNCNSSAIATMKAAVDQRERRMQQSSAPNNAHVGTR